MWASPLLWLGVCTCLREASLLLLMETAMLAFALTSLPPCLPAMVGWTVRLWAQLTFSMLKLPLVMLDTRYEYTNKRQNEKRMAGRVEGTRIKEGRWRNRMGTVGEIFSKTISWMEKSILCRIYPCGCRRSGVGKYLYALWVAKYQCTMYKITKVPMFCFKEEGSLMKGKW